MRDCITSSLYGRSNVCAGCASRYATGASRATPVTATTATPRMKSRLLAREMLAEHVPPCRLTRCQDRAVRWNRHCPAWATPFSSLTPPPFGFSVTCSKRRPRSRRRNLSGFSASRGRSVGDRAPGLLGTPCPVSSLPSSALAARPSLCRLAASACLVRVTCPHTAEG